MYLSTTMLEEAVLLKVSLKRDFGIKLNHKLKKMIMSLFNLVIMTMKTMLVLQEPGKTYDKYLTQYATEVQKLGGIPIIMSPVSRRN